MAGDRVDFFVSHAGQDRAWAEWVAWQLTDAGYSVELDVWDWAAGRNFVTAMGDALERANRVLALFSSAYFERPRYTTMEWASSLASAPGTAEDRLVPVRVEDVPADKVPAMLRPLVYCDVFGTDEDTARDALLGAAAGGGGMRARRPVFPGGQAGRLSRLGGSGPRRPGALPSIWNMPARNPGFTGRDGLLMAVRESLLGSDRAVVQALHGMGGVGKTQLAVEYAHRFAGGYDLVWWITAERAALIGEQFAALADALGCARPGAGQAAIRQAVLAVLRERDRALLVFDNADSPEELADWLPGGRGHVLITTRTHGWAEIAAPVEVDVLARAESVAILRSRVPDLPAGDAGRVAAALGDLPLAIAQAAGYMADTGIPDEEYTDLLAARAAEILDQARPSSYPQSLAAVTQLAFDRLTTEDPATGELAELCAFMAPEPIPAHWFTRAAEDLLPALLAEKVADPVAWRQVLARIGHHALVRVERNGLQMHRLTQAIIRSHLPASTAIARRGQAEAIVAASHPGDERSPSSWPGWARLLPHLLAMNPADNSDARLRAVAQAAAWYLVRRGDSRGGHDLAGQMYQRWRDRLGPDDGDTLKAAVAYAYALREMGRYDEALELDQDALARYRRTLGDDDADTLSAAHNVGADLYELGSYREAAVLDKDILFRRRRILGDDHPDTLSSAGNLAGDLRGLGELLAARDLDEDNLARRRRILGDDHPHTLTSASSLTLDLRALGDLLAARELCEDTLSRRRSVLGDDHPRTLASASDLASVLRELGDYQTARELDEETLNRCRRVLGDDHPRTHASAENLAADLRELEGN